MIVLSLPLLILTTSFYPSSSLLNEINNRSVFNPINIIAISILFLSGPLIFSNSIASVNNHIILPSIIQLIVPIFSILFLFLFGHKFHILSVAFGMYIGQLLNLIFIFYINFKDGIRPGFGAFNFNFPGKKYFRLNFINLICIALLGNLIIPINTFYAGSLGVGAISIYSFGSKLTGAIISFISSIFALIVLPYLSHMAINFDSKVLTREIYLMILYGTLISIPISLLLFLGSDFISSVLFNTLHVESKNFIEFVNVIKYSFVQLPFWLFNIIILRHANVISRIKPVALASLLSFFVNIFLSYYLIRSMNLGGLSLSGSISVAFSSFFLLTYYFFIGFFKLKDCITFSVYWVFYVFLIIVLALNYNVFT